MLLRHLSIYHSSLIIHHFYATVFIKKRLDVKSVI